MLYNGPITSHTQEVGLAVGEIIGNLAEASAAVDIIQASVEHGLIFHGTRTEDSLELIDQQGVAPRTPEGRTNGQGCSYWTSGERFFFSQFTRRATYDTSFFHYAHLKSRTAGKGVMAVCIADVSRLRNNGIYVNPESVATGYIAIDDHVPRSLIDIVKVERQKDPNVGLRTNGQILERDLLHAIRGHLSRVLE
jgi:hypothetical protein